VQADGTSGAIPALEGSYGMRKKKVSITLSLECRGLNLMT
jgi:hypothetical protein